MDINDRVSLLIEMLDIKQKDFAEKLKPVSYTHLANQVLRYSRGCILRV